MPTITPVTRPVGMVRDWQTPAERAIARIVGPLPTGESLVKQGGAWKAVRSPSQDFLDSCEIVFTGGHVYDISDELWAEIQADAPEGHVPTLIDDDDLLVSEGGDQLVSQADDDLETE